jgi:hypothetical protein
MVLVMMRPRNAAMAVPARDVPARDVPGRDVPASYVATADVPSTVHVCPLSSCRWLPGSSHGGKGVSNDYADVRKRGAY